MSIFKAYDIRGIYPEELDEELAYKIGRATATFLKVKQIVVGRDVRLSGRDLFDAVAKGITEQGVDVIDIGLCSSPMLYFAVNFLKAKGSVMVTASHNPKEYNGFKFTREKAIPISGDSGIKDIEKLVNKNQLKEAKKKGKIIKKEILNNYAKFVLRFAKKIKPLKVVIDTANGMGGLEAPRVFDKLKCKVIPLFFELNGTFPNHDPNPLKGESLRFLIEKVKEEKADLGIAFDGDADRVFFTTENGEIIPADFITCLIAKEMLKHHPKEKILYDLRSSWIVKEVVEACGGKTLMSRVGHAFIKEQLRKEKGIFAGELSGHFYFRDAFYTDSGIIAAIWILNLLSSEGKNFSELIKPLKKYYASGEINSEVEDKEGKMKELAKIYKDGKVSWLDGIRVDYKDWWFNVRPSNTEPLLRLNLEAKSKELMEKKRDEIVKIIRR